MTDLKDFAPIQINTLYGFENVQDFYWLVGYDVVNVKTGRKLKFSLHKGKFPFFSLSTKDKSKSIDKKCLLHHLLALAYIKNGEYEAVEYIDGNPLNFDISNLRFLTYSELMRNAYKRSALSKRPYEATLTNGETYVGSLREISRQSGISIQTLSKRYRAQTPGSKIQSIKLI